MDEIKGIRIVSLTGEKVYGIEDSEVREELANVVDGAPEELDSFKEAFEKFKEGGEALAGIEQEITKEAQRATEAEAELLNRLQGASELSDAAKDPFKFLGEFLTPNSEELHAALNNLHSTDKANGYEGVWRFAVQGKPSVLYNFAMNYPQDKWLQGLITTYSPTGNSSAPFTINNKVNILYRSLEGGNWSSWRLMTQDNTDAIAAETARAVAAETELRKAAVTKKRNYIHATNDSAYIIAKYDNRHDIIIRFARTLLNELYTMEDVYLVDNTGTELSTDTTREPVYRFCQQRTSDMIGPVSVRTGATGLSWIGGNHLYLNQESGIKTAKTIAVIVNADDISIGSGQMYADKITIRVKNEIYDPNVAPASGADILSSKLIDEFVTYTIDGGEVLVSVEHKYNKDIYIATYYGMQSMFTQYSNLITNTINDWKAKESSYSILKSYQDFNRFSQKDANGYYQNTILFPYGIGNHQLVEDGSEVFVESGSKAYHVLIKSQNIKTGDVLSWMGVYSWRKPLIDNEGNYIYAYNDKGEEYLSITAKEAYANKTIPVTPSIANKVYKSEGDVKVENIIGYNIVLSAATAGSSIIRTTNNIERELEKSIAEETRRATAMEQQLLEWMDADKQESQTADEEIKASAMQYNTLGINVYADKAEIYGRSIYGTPRVHEFPAATTEKSGVMSAEDKIALENIPNAIEEGEKRALRRLFIAAGAEYNDTDAVQIRKVKFDTSETVEHLPHCYCLNGLGDISEEEMLKIYNLGCFYGGVYGALSGLANRTNLGRSGSSNFPMDSPSLAYSSKCTTISLCIPTVGYESTFYVKSNNYFSDATNLRAIYGRLVMENSYSNTFNNCVSLERVRIRTSVSVSLGSSPLINKKSLLYAIENATPAAAITITLHPDAYARLADDAEVIAALEAQPLVSLVSA